MHDDTTFERQIGVVLGRMGGPEPTFDALAVARAAAIQSPRWGFPSVVGATRFVLAAAFVALFGGLLLAMVLTQSGGDKMAPAAEVDSPSPTTTEELLSGMVTKEVAPGVLRVVRDDAGHDLASLGVFEIAVGPDGAVWMNGRGGLFRLREPGITDSQPNGLRTGLTVGPDGSVWSRGAWQRRDRSLRSFDGERWVYHPGPTVEGLIRNDQLGPSFAIGPDGSAWGAWVNAEKPQPPGFEFARLEGGRWVAVDLTGWPDGLIGNANPAYGPGLVATDDGSLWMIASNGEVGEDWRTVLMRYDGTTWDAVETPFDPWWIADGPDGSWVLVDRNVGTHDGETRIARFVQGAWSESRVQLPDATEYWSEDTLRPVVASDGAVWLRVNLPDRAGGRQHVFPEGCDGVARVVGSTWTHHLAGTCIWDVAAGPHGEVWVATWDGTAEDQRPGDVYVIRPAESDSLMQPRGDEMAPAATATPSPTTTEALLSSMVTEEVEPGVYRILDDGAGHDLAAMHLGGVWDGGDGSMWVLEERVIDLHWYGDHRLLRLGDAGDTPIDIGNTYWFDMAVDADATVWAKTGADYQLGALATNDGTSMPWRERSAPETFPGLEDGAYVRAVEAGPDGSIWVTRKVLNAAGPWVARHDGSGWTVLPSPDDPELQGDYHGEGPYVDVGTDGTVWVANGNLHTNDSRGPQGILRFDGTAWVLESPVPERADLHAGPLAVGPDGTAWVYLASREPVPPGLRLLARWSDGEWTTYGSVIGLLAGQGYEARLAVDSAGTLWIAFDGGGGPYMSFAQRAAGLENPTPDEGPCTGLLSFDGASWRQYLRGRCVNHVAVAPDGSIWASAATHPDSTDLDIDAIDGLYVITPEVVAGTE